MADAHAAIWRFHGRLTCCTISPLHGKIGRSQDRTISGISRVAETLHILHCFHFSSFGFQLFFVNHFFSFYFRTFFFRVNFGDRQITHVHLCGDNKKTNKQANKQTNTLVLPIEKTTFIGFCFFTCVFLWHLRSRTGRSGSSRWTGTAGPINGWMDFCLVLWVAAGMFI